MRYSFLGRLLLAAVGLAVLSAPSQPVAAAPMTVASLADPCDPQFREETGFWGGPILLTEEIAGNAKCARYPIYADQVAVIGAGELKVEKDGEGVIFDTTEALVAVAGPATVTTTFKWGAVRVVRADRAQCEFDSWASAEAGFKNHHPLSSWTGAAVCGSLPKAEFSVAVNPTIVDPKNDVSFTITSEPSGAPFQLNFGDSAAEAGTSPATITHHYVGGKVYTWQLVDPTDQTELATGTVDVLDVRGCYVLPARETWNEAPSLGNPLFAFSTDEDTSGRNTLRICGKLPGGASLVIIGEVIGEEGYGVIRVIHGPYDFNADPTYVRNALVYAAPSCTIQAEYDRLLAEAKAAGNEPPIKHEPATVTCVYVPILQK